MHTRQTIKSKDWNEWEIKHSVLKNNPCECGGEFVEIAYQKGTEGSIFMCRECKK